MFELTDVVLVVLRRYRTQLETDPRACTPIEASWMGLGPFAGSASRVRGRG